MEEQVAQCAPNCVSDVTAENDEPFLQVVHQGALHLGQYLSKRRRFVRFLNKKTRINNITIYI